jgi:hypothetical protein
VRVPLVPGFKFDNALLERVRLQARLESLIQDNSLLLFVCLFVCFMVKNGYLQRDSLSDDDST